MSFDPKDPDASLVALFKNHAQKNEAKSAIAGRPIFDDVEVVEIRKPGARDFSVHPATAFCGWHNDQFTGEQRPWTYAERFQRQYRQFKENLTQTKTGTPLEYVPFLTEGRRAELKALNVYTIEALAHLDGQELKNLGPGGREMKNQAEEFIAESKRIAPSTQLQSELEAERARRMALEEDNNALKASIKLKATEEKSGDDMFDEMSDSQLKDYIGAQTGARPLGGSNRRTLLRMAMEAKQAKVSA